MSPQDRQPALVAELLDGAVRRLSPEGHLLVKLLARWEAIVGTAVAAHARPVSLVGGLLTINVDQPGWATQLRYLEAELCRKCDEALNDCSGGVGVRRLAVRVRPR